MLIYTFGAKHYLGQLNTIIKSLRDLGHTVDSASSAPELIYSADAGGYEESVQLWEKYARKPKLMLTVLDIPWHVKEINIVLDKLKMYLPLADRVTTISKTVQKQIKDTFNLESDVIYAPTRIVEHIPTIKKVIDLFINGRVCDRNKRAFLALQAAQDLDKILVCVGSEYIASKYNKVYNYGVVSDLELCTIYNRSKITLALGLVEGLGMQIPESLICGTPIITLSDNPTNFEFLPIEMIVEPNIDAIKNKIDEILNNYDKYQKIALEYGDKYKEQFSGKSIANNILKVYESLV